jgi:16S rRNA (cytosine1402-N4)-methyltransferase
LNDVKHIPVLAEEAVSFLLSAPDGVGVDATVGLGGHAVAWLERGPSDLRLVGFDRDPEALDLAARRLAAFGDRVRLVHADFADMERHVTPEERSRVTAVLIDAGLSSLQIDEARRGFSYERDGPLDMRADPSAPLSARDVANDMSEGELTRVLGVYGEVSRPKEVARAIVAARRRRPLETTADVVRALRDEISPRFPRKSVARVFQALRIEVNDEIGRLRRGLHAAARILSAGGVLVVISYHSLEDREVKYYLRDNSKGAAPVWDLLTRHVVRPSRSETLANPRARSARLRAARRSGA